VAQRTQVGAYHELIAALNHQTAGFGALQKFSYIEARQDLSELRQVLNRGEVAAAPC